ncbi:hypothetical protein H9W90_08520 [Polaribacter pectinis]|uniref:Calx-beta domain-containing protein n=1 Tax=Polaribacter pectinis TaxID=2738844 RepID=A0A7G9L6K6_9FLAO|nr:hypothetical protein [Polaribacter pectinis]QNM84255.1 hypothetical protein H9W90_08520 [Polaribacter pectinis]
MKNNFFKIIVLFLSVIVFTSCEDEDKNVYSGDNFISFGTTYSQSALESSQSSIVVTAYASVGNIQSDINVDFELVTEQGTSADYTVVGGKSQFNFGAGKYVDTIELVPVDNFDEDGDKIIKITLTSASDGSSLGLPGPDANGKTFTVTFEDDDCAFTVEELGTSTFSGTDNVPGSQAGPNESLVTTSFDGTNLLIEGLSYGWMTDTGYWDEVVVDSFPVIAKVDPVTGAMTIDLQPLCNTTWNGDPQAPYSLEGTGQYVSCSETLTISYNLYQNGAVLRSFTETLTKN